MYDSKQHFVLSWKHHETKLWNKQKVRYTSGATSSSGLSSSVAFIDRVDHDGQTKRKRSGLRMVCIVNLSQWAWDRLVREGPPTGTLATWEWNDAFPTFVRNETPYLQLQLLKADWTLIMKQKYSLSKSSSSFSSEKCSLYFCWRHQWSFSASYTVHFPPLFFFLFHCSYCPPYHWVRLPL